MKRKLSEITWLDAADDADVPLHKITHSKDHLVLRTTYGHILVNDDDGVVVLRDITKEDECEITAIPKQMLVSIT